MLTEYWEEIQNERDHLEELGVDGKLWSMCYGKKIMPKLLEKKFCINCAV